MNQCRWLKICAKRSDVEQAFTSSDVKKVAKTALQQRNKEVITDVRITPMVDLCLRVFDEAANYFK